jgi:hypothetical protein
MNSRNIPQEAKDMGDFLEKVLPLQAFATLTTRRQISQSEFDHLLREWLRGVQSHNGLTIGTIKAYEYGVRRHAHLGLIAAAPLDCLHAERLWEKLTAPRYRRAAVVEPFSIGVAGLGYIMKSLNAPTEEIMFSDNLAAFAKGTGKSQFLSTSAQRRQHRRIQTQLEKYDGCLIPPIFKACSPKIPADWFSANTD